MQQLETSKQIVEAEEQQYKRMGKGRPWPNPVEYTAKCKQMYSMSKVNRQTMYTTLSNLSLT